jgi:hypothetical protein
MSPARPSDGPARWWSEGAGGHINAVCRLIEPHVAGARGRLDCLNNSVLVGLAAVSVARSPSSDRTSGASEIQVSGNAVIRRLAGDKTLADL